MLRAEELRDKLGCPVDHQLSQENASSPRGILWTHKLGYVLQSEALLHRELELRKTAGHSIPMTSTGYQINTCNRTIIVYMNMMALPVQ